MLTYLNSKKVVPVLALTVFMFLFAGPTKSFAACPYDILALCQVDGKWVNCCDHYGYTVNGVEKSDPPKRKLNLKAVKPASGQQGPAYKAPSSSPNGSASIYQMDGMSGSVPMKLTTKVVNGNEVTVMKLASKNLNQEMTWNAKLECGEGTVANHFEFQTANGFKSAFPPGSLNTQSVNKNVQIKPWSLNTVESQCADALTNGNGDYNKEAIIWLQPTPLDVVKFDASCKYSGTNNVKQYSGQADPKTKVKCTLTNPPYKPET
jgi:hypothetical protein